MFSSRYKEWISTKMLLLHASELRLLKALGSYWLHSAYTLLLDAFDYPVTPVPMLWEILFTSRFI